MASSELSQIHESLLVVRAQAREEAAFQELVKQYERRMLYYVHRLLGSETERADVMQDIWFKVFMKLPSLRVPEAFRVWLYKIAHDIAVSQLRTNRRHATTSLTDEFIEDPDNTSTWDELELLENAEFVHEALGKLSLPHREVLTLRFLEELELADIAEVVRCSVGTVKSRLHYAKLAMRKLLEATCRD